MTSLLYANRDPRDLPAYLLSSVASYLRLPESTLRLWARGQGSGAAPLFPVAEKHPPTLSFWNVVEAYVLAAIRREHRVSMQKVRRALDFVSRRLGVDRPLIRKVFLSDGVSLFVEEFAELMDVSKAGQLAWKKLLETSLRRVDRDVHGLALRVYPWVLSPTEPRWIEIDPRRSFGKPVVCGTGIPTEVLAQRFRAGDSIDHLAEDYRLTREQIETALRWESHGAVA